jgi:hypothetical protein
MGKTLKDVKGSGHGCFQIIILECSRTKENQGQRPDIRLGIKPWIYRIRIRSVNDFRDLNQVPPE